MPINKELLLATLDKCEEESKKPCGLWYQTDWDRKRDCGTALCFAGWAIVLSGRPLLPNGHLDIKVCYSTDANEVLGITHNQGAMLYAGDNSISDLRKIVENIIEESEEVE